MTKRLALCLLLTTSAAFASTPPATPPATPVEASLGYWRSAIGAIVRIEPCTNAPSTICLRIVKLSPNPPSTTDPHNPDPALRSRKICGVEIGSGFTQADDHRLGSGHLYDPISGHTYRGYITPAGPDTLKLRGYILFTLFGRTETWTRVPPIEACK
jgi:uncharacterized protein (DUF2147 family)